MLIYYIINMFLCYERYNKIFSRKPEHLFKNIDKLPHELVSIIYSYIPKPITISLNKTTYIKDHKLITNHIIKQGQMENYIRSMVRQDNDFVFKLLLKENYQRWLIMKDYYYKNCIYLNYILFLESYAIDNESTKCRTIISDLFEELGLKKNQHKKNTIKYIRWRT